MSRTIGLTRPPAASTMCARLAGCSVWPRRCGLAHHGKGGVLVDRKGGQGVGNERRFIRRQSGGSARRTVAQSSVERAGQHAPEGRHRHRRPANAAEGDQKGDQRGLAVRLLAQGHMQRTARWCPASARPAMAATSSLGKAVQHGRRRRHRTSRSARTMAPQRHGRGVAAVRVWHGPRGPCRWRR